MADYFADDPDEIDDDEDDDFDEDEDLDEEDEDEEEEEETWQVCVRRPKGWPLLDFPLRTA
jgi:hypothetical protein